MDIKEQIEKIVDKVKMDSIGDIADSIKKLF